ncbi:MAG: RICIN domain-containing protein, partial [Atopobiaceae bacterium]
SPTEGATSPSASSQAASSPLAATTTAAPVVTPAASGVADGVYAIECSVGSRMVLDVAGGSKANGANVQSWSSNASNAQRWKVASAGGGWYSITSVVSGKSLDVAGAQGKAGTNVQQYSANGSAAQLWRFVENPDGSYAIYSKLGNLVLDIAGGLTSDGANLDVWSPNGTSAQRYRLVSAAFAAPAMGQTIASGSYRVGVGSSRELVAKGGSLDAAVPIVSAASGSDLSGAFCFSFDSASGYYLIYDEASSRLLDADGGDVVPGAVVRQQGTSASGFKQRLWSVGKNPDGSYAIVNAANGQTLGLSGSTAITCPSADGRALSVSLSPSSIPWSSSEVSAFANDHASDLADGTYAISASASLHRVFDVDGGSHANGANVRLWSSNSSQAQRWKVATTVSGGTSWRTITCVGSGKALDVCGARTSLGGNVWQYASNGTAAQRWVIASNGNGTYTLWSGLGHGLVTDLPGGSTSEGSNIQTWYSNGTAAQRFVFSSASSAKPQKGKTIDDGLYSLSVGGRVLDVAGGATGNGSVLQAWDSNGTLAQGFSVDYDSSAGYYRITGVGSNRSIDLDNGDVIPGGKVQIWDSISNDQNQLWSIQENGGGTYRIVNVASGLALAVGSGRGSRLTTATDGTSFGFSKYTPRVVEGCYSIWTSAGGHCLDVSGGTWSAGGNVQIWDGNATQAQKWYVREVSKGIVTLQCVGSGEYLVERNDNAVQGWDGGSARQWEVGYSAGKGLTFKNLANGKALDLSGGVNSSGRNVGTYAANGTAAQAWTLTDTPLFSNEGFYEISPVSAAGKRLDVSGGSSGNGANVQIWSSNGGLAQRWWIRGAGNGYYTLTSCCGAKALDVKNGSSAPGTNVQQWERNGASAQKWKFSMGASGLELVSACGGTVLDVAGGQTGNGTNVQVWTANNSAAQAFRLSAAATPSKIGYQNPSWLYQVSSWSVRPKHPNAGIFSYVTPSRIAIDASRSDCVNAFVGRAWEYMGTGYVWDYACAPGVGVDCSGLVIQCLYATGMDTVFNPYDHMYDPWQDHDANNIFEDSRFEHVGVGDRQPGDIVCYYGHVGIYIGGDTMISATTWGGSYCVRTNSIWDSMGGMRGMVRPFA